MGLVDVKAKMALSPASSSSPDTAIVIHSETSSPPSSVAPKKKRTFDIAFLTGQSETSDEGTSITRPDKFCPTSASLYAAPAPVDDDDSDDYRPNNRFTVLSQNSAVCPRTEGGQPTNHVFSVFAGINSSFDAINNGSCQNDKGSLENGSKYKLFESFSGNNHNTNGPGSGTGYLAQNLWKDQSNADTHSHSSSSNNSNPKTSSKGRKNKSSQAGQKSAKSSSQGAATPRSGSDLKKPYDLSPPLYSSPPELQLQFLHNQHQHHLKDESLSPERQSLGSAQLRASHDLVTSSASFQTRNLTPSSPFSSFLPQIGRFPIHLPSPLTGNGNNHQSSHNGSHSHALNNSQSPSTFSPPILNDKFTKEQHQQIISAFHQHQQQQNSMNRIRAAMASGFAPENLYPSYAPYPSAAAAALYLSQSASNSTMANLGLMNPNASPPTSMPSFQHNGNRNPVTGSNGQCQASTLSPTGNPLTTATLLPPSLTSLTLPAQNVCAKCNIGFRMTSDLVYHMRSHHKRETDPMKKKREDKLKCNVCFETFRERHHLTRHMTAHQDRAEEMIHDAAAAAAAAALEHESKPIITNHCA